MYDGGFDRFRHRRFPNQFPRLCADVVEVGKIGLIQFAQQVRQGLAQFIFFQKHPVRFGGDGKTVGHEDAFGRELGEHFPQRGIFAAYKREFSDGNLREVFDKGGHDIPIFVSIKDGGKRRGGGMTDVMREGDFFGRRERQKHKKN